MMSWNNALWCILVLQQAGAAHKVHVIAERDTLDIVVHPSAHVGAAAYEACKQTNNLTTQCVRSLMWLTRQTFAQQNVSLTRMLNTEQTVEYINAGTGVLLFLHLKKCGGTTVERSVFELSGLASLRSELVEHYWRESAEAHWRGQYEQALLHSVIFSGHNPFGVHVFVSPRPFVYMSVVREPISRLVSLHAYLAVASSWTFPCPLHPGDSETEQRLCRNEWWPPSIPAGTGVRQFFEAYPATSHKTLYESDNYMTRMLCGAEAVMSGSAATPEMLQCALRNMESEIAFVAVMERMQESLCITSSIMGWSNRQGMQEAFSAHFNKNTGGQDKMKADLAEDARPPRHLYALDEVVYRTAVKLLEVKLQHHPQCVQVPH
jgi:hypothetical protein